MNPDQILLGLAAADPARDIDPNEQPTAEQIDAARHRTVPADVIPRTRPRARRALVPSLGLLAVGATALVVLPGAGTPIDLTAEAYAQTTAPRGRIAYALVTATSTQTTKGKITRRERYRDESWAYGKESHTVTSIFPPDRRPMVADHVTGTDGVMHHIDNDGMYRIVRPSDNEDSANVIATEQAGFVAEFRKSYERGQLDPAGDTTYAGRPARRYIVRDPRRPERGFAQSFYLDRKTGAPLGMITESQAFIGNAPESDGPTTMRYASVVRKLAALPPTAENLRNLRTPTIVRRRDADGCIHGPVTRARSSDTARRYDCGGPPNGPVLTP
ncbi:hypothetical protein AB0L40_04295 [Patulibacter sp. NPDC049589]|uniref:hypothetical protein n=1 Tax=Patulibacter sp. NPDC049589 TaxID=3154731 RepID=UPI0034146A59